MSGHSTYKLRWEKSSRCTDSRWISRIAIARALQTSVRLRPLARLLALMASARSCQCGGIWCRPGGRNRSRNDSLDGVVDDTLPCRRRHPVPILCLSMFILPLFIIKRLSPHRSGKPARRGQNRPPSFPCASQKWMRHDRDVNYLAISIAVDLGGGRYPVFAAARSVRRGIPNRTFKAGVGGEVRDSSPLRAACVAAARLLTMLGTTWRGAHWRRRGRWCAGACWPALGACACTHAGTRPCPSC
jgi:hypothetical protein